MQHGTFLDIASLADHDGLVVAAYDGARPYAGLGLQFDLANKRGFDRDESRLVDLGGKLAQLITGHCGRYTGGQGAGIVAQGCSAAAHAWAQSLNVYIKNIQNVS